METLTGHNSAPSRTADQFRDSTWLIATMVSVLRQHFGGSDRMSLETSKYTWSPHTEETKLVIDNTDNLNFGEGEVFPKLIVGLEDQNFPRDYIADFDNYDMASAERNYTVRTDSAFTIESWALHNLEALALCDEVRIFLQTFRREISCTYNFHSLRPLQQNKPVKSKVHTDYWIARLVVSFEVTATWGVQVEQLKASAINLNLRVE